MSACTSSNTAIKNQYKLTAFSSKQSPHHTHTSILVSPTEAMAGYQTEQMLYVNKPFELSHFAHNAWASAPASMLFPLMILSLQNTHYFSAVASGAYADKTDYRVDTQLLSFQQNYLTKPSTIELNVKVVLTHVDDNRVIASMMIKEQVACPADTPYGGVMAANIASKRFTASVSNFVIKHIEQDKG